MRYCSDFSKTNDLKLYYTLDNSHVVISDETFSHGFNIPVYFVL